MSEVPQEVSKVEEGTPRLDFRYEFPTLEKVDLVTALAASCGCGCGCQGGGGGGGGGGGSRVQEAIATEQH
jgi:hypothetical protein